MLPMNRSASVRTWRSNRSLGHLDPRASQDRIEHSGELGVAVTDEEPAASSGVIEVHDEGAGLLGQPGAGRMGGDAEDVDLAGGVFDDEERVEPGEGEGVKVEQVAGQDAVSLGPEKFRPGRSGPSWRGVDPGSIEDLPHGGGADLVAQACEFVCTRRYPQVGLSVARRTVSVRSPGGMAGRPARRRLVVQRRATSCRCQRKIVAGVTSSPARRWLGSRRTSAPINARSGQNIRGRVLRRFRTASWWRSTRISMSLSAVDRASRTIQPTSRVTIK